MSNHNILTLDNLSLHDFDTEADLIPLLSPEDEEIMANEELPNSLAILPLRNTVLFPGVVIPITAGRDKSIKLINDANAAGKVIGVVAQKDEDVEDPKRDDIHSIGTVAQILRVLKMPDGNVTVIIQGKKRFEITKVISEEPYLNALVKEVPEKRPSKTDTEFGAIIESIKEMAIRIIKESPNIPTEATFAIKNIESQSFLINFVSSNMNLDVKEKQSLLMMNILKERALTTLRYMNTELQKLELRNDIQSKVRVDLDQQQREYFLHQQMKTIQEELGGVSYDQEIDEMRAKAKSKKWDEKTEKHFEKEISKLQRTNPQSPDFGILRNYLELFLELPWNHFSKDIFDLKRAQKILDKDHFGLEDVKKRIIEHLAVLKLRNDMKSPILCLTGPPGVGKTSIGKSIAKALGREYVRMSLGGLRDEAEIRGHRKTYIGAMPGRILQSIKKAGTSNPVFVLDEIDKLSVSHSGDPSSALLEVLDPEQNHSFYDNYLESEYDLSKTLFIATANDISQIQPALRDRLEIIDLSGYAVEEKVEIAKRHLFPKQRSLHGLEKYNFKIQDNVLEKVIEDYTRESGVRELDRQLASIMRYQAKQIAYKQKIKPTVSKLDLLKILGQPRYSNEIYKTVNMPGVAVGLAWTYVGGDILFIETLLSDGKGELKLTGNLGNVMKESATTAMTYLQANAKKIGVDPTLFTTKSVHMHVPEGAVPKDGPSAGITILTALSSAYTGRKVKPFLAMTGEITLRGQVLPVGGIKEKILAAKRAGMKEIILCWQNEKDVNEIDQAFIKGVKFYYVKNMQQVLDLAIV
jgi:ATP-dependent Lon protease